VGTVQALVFTVRRKAACTSIDAGNMISRADEAVAGEAVR